MRHLVRLYPADWRERYGDELSALTEERRVSLFGMLDLLRGAVDAWQHPRGSHQPGHGPPSADIQVALARWAGFVLFVTGTLGMLRVVGDEAGWLHLWSTGGIWIVLASVLIIDAFLLVGLAGLWIQARRAGQGSLVAEIIMLFTIGAYLLFVGNFLVPALLPSWATTDGAVQLESLCIVCGILLEVIPITLRRLLPPWSMFTLLLIPLLVAMVAGITRQHWLQSFDHMLLCLSLSWVLVGGGLLLVSTTARMRAALP